LLLYHKPSAQLPFPTYFTNNTVPNGVLIITGRSVLPHPNTDETPTDRPLKPALHPKRDKCTTPQNVYEKNSEAHAATDGRPTPYVQSSANQTFAANDLALHRRVQSRVVELVSRRRDRHHVAPRHHAAVRLDRRERHVVGAHRVHLRCQ
jgi:hypothetical protein